MNSNWKKYIDNIQILTGTGWGTTENGTDSDALRTLNIRRQPAQICRQYIGAKIVGSQFCAGNWNSNLCNGDSGGPLGALISFQNSKRFVQIGIASFTNRQCKYASVYTDVMSHIDFILKVWRNFGSGHKKTVSNRPQVRPSTRPPTRPPSPPITRPPAPPTIPPTPNPPSMPPFISPIPEPNFKDTMTAHWDNNYDSSWDSHEGHYGKVDYEWYGDYSSEGDSHEYFYEHRYPEHFPMIMF